MQAGVGLQPTGANTDPAMTAFGTGAGDAFVCNGGLKPTLRFTANARQANPLAANKREVKGRNPRYLQRRRKEPE